MKRIILLTLSLFCIVGISNAQFGGLVKKAQRQAEKSLNKRLEKEVEKKVDQEVNKAVDKALDKAEEDLADSTKQSSQEQHQRAQEERLSGIMKSLGVGVDVPHKDTYTFGAVMKMLMEHRDDNGKKDEPMRYNSYFDAEHSDYAIQFINEEGQQSHFIFDYDNQCSLILSIDGDDKTGIISAIDEKDIHNWIEDRDESLAENSRYKKTGRTKTISGFKCDEYEYENEEGKTTIWVTDEPKNKINKGLYKSSAFGGSMMFGGKTDGVLILYEFNSARSKEQTRMTVTSIDFKTSNSINTETYQMMGINVGQ